MEKISSQPRQLLVVAPDLSQGKSLSFVLELAGYRTTVVRTLFEAADWAIKRLNTAEAFSDLVVGPGQSDADTAWLVELLGAAGVAIPLVSTTSEPGGDGRSSHIGMCPEKIVARLDQLLRTR